MKWSMSVPTLRSAWTIRISVLLSHAWWPPARLSRGVVVCGSGQGVCMAANKVPGARAGVVRDDHDAQMIRRHNDANIACFGERVTDVATAVSALGVFMATEFEAGRHTVRVDQLGALDHGDEI